MSDRTLAATLIVGAVLLYLVWNADAPVATVTTSEDFSLPPSAYPAGLITMAQAIARAEGFYVPGSVPQRAHNPGDIKVPGWTGPTIGGISAFDSDDEGWNALYRQLWLIVTGQSGVYNLDMTITDMASRYTATQQDAWAANVGAALGVDPSTTRLSEVIV